jgi:hypothetical protein
VSSRRGRAGIVVAALVAAAAIGAVAALRQRPEATEDAVTAGAASRPPEARLQKETPPALPAPAPEPAPSAAEEAPVPDEPRPKPAAKHSKAKARTAVGTETATSPASKPAGIASPSPVGPRAAGPKSPVSGGASKSGFVPPPISDPGF